MGKHVHDWRLMHKSDITTRHRGTYLSRQAVLDIITDPGDSSEHWTCPDCGEDRYKYRPGYMAAFVALSPPDHRSQDVGTDAKLKGGE